MKITTRMFAILCLMLAIVITVHAQEDAVDSNLRDGCVEDYDSETDYFPDKISVEYAENFDVTYFNNYKIVTILPWPGAESELEYVLVQCGTPAPQGFDDVPTFEVPVQRFVAMSTSMLPHLDDQGVLDHLVGVDTTLFTSNEAVLELVESGDVVEIGGGGTAGEINLELLLNIEPDLVMAQEFFAGGTTLSQLNEVGVPAVLNADYADTSPLGQAEWGKFVSLFFNTEAEADMLFSGVAERYQDLVALTVDVDERPTVVAASPFDGTWYMPGSESTIAQLLADAGADFLWADEPGTSVPLDFEIVFDRAVEADYWVNVNQFWRSTADMLADDSRFAEFRAYNESNIWNNNRRMNENGGSDYFESGAANPDVILADLITIFHPDLLPEHELVYYQQLADSE